MRSTLKIQLIAILLFLIASPLFSTTHFFQPRESGFLTSLGYGTQQSNSTFPAFAIGYVWDGAFELMAAYSSTQSTTATYSSYALQFAYGFAKQGTGMPISLEGTLLLGGVVTVYDSVNYWGSYPIIPMPERDHRISSLGVTMARTEIINEASQLLYKLGLDNNAIEDEPDFVALNLGVAYMYNISKDLTLIGDASLAMSSYPSAFGVSLGAKYKL